MVNWKSGWQRVRAVALIRLVSLLALVLVPGCASENPEDHLHLVFGEMATQPVVLAHRSQEATESWLVKTDKLPSSSGEVKISPINRNALIGIAAALGVNLESSFELECEGFYHEWTSSQGHIRTQFVPIDSGYVAYVEFLKGVEK